MAPSAVETETAASVSIPVPPSKISHREPLKLSGALDKYEQVELTPTIGREFPTANLVEWLDASDSDALLRDLAITISQRGVVFFRKQDNLTNDLQKQLILRLGQLTGRPSTSTLHIHPLLNSSDEFAGGDTEISTIDSVQQNKGGALAAARKKQALEASKGGRPSFKNPRRAQWHSDIAFEPVPADYTSLRLVELPKTGGDTLWASGYDIYDSISKPYQTFLETLSVTFSQPAFLRASEANGIPFFDGQRGAPENVGKDLTAVHPLVRTNPVTGWKSIFPVGGHIGYINDVTSDESKALLDWFQDLVYHNHDLQVRFKWTSPNDIAIWDNRSVFHTATFDLDGQGDRRGNRVVGLGERPYFDPQSKSRREDLNDLVVGPPFQFA